MIELVYNSNGKHFPKCKVCKKQLFLKDSVYYHRGYYYCNVCAEVFKNERVRKLEEKIKEVKKK